MSKRLNKALSRRLAGLALGGLIALTAVPTAMAQWLPPWPVAMTQWRPAWPTEMGLWPLPWRSVSPAVVEERLRAHGYVLIAPLQRRPSVYLADVAGPVDHQRLVIDARNGDILQRFIAPAPPWAPELAAREGVLGGPMPAPPFEPLPIAPNGSAPSKPAPGGTANIHIPEAISPFGPPPDASSKQKTKPKGAATARKLPATPPIPPVRPDSSKPVEPPATPNSGKPNIELTPTEVENDLPGPWDRNASATASVVSPASFE